MPEIKFIFLFFLVIWSWNPSSIFSMAFDDEDDLVLDNPEFDRIVRAQEQLQFEYDSPAPPDLQLHVNIYMDVQWKEYFGKFGAEREAKNIIKHTK